MLLQIVQDVSAVSFSILFMSLFGVYLKLRGFLTKDKAKHLSKIGE